jgi:amino acid permease
MDASTLLPPSINDAAVRKGTAYKATVLSILQLMAGTGILGLPQAVADGGWLCLPIMVVVGLMANYTAKALIKTLYAEPRKETHVQLANTYGERLPCYPSVGYAAFGTFGRLVVQLFHKATLFGVSTIFLILAGAFLVEGIGGGGEGLFGTSFGSAATEKAWTQRWTVISAAVAAVPLCALRTLREIAPVAALGVLASVLTVVIVVAESAALYPITNSSLASKHLPTSAPLQFDPATGDVMHATFVPGMRAATSFSTMVLSFGGHAVLPSVEAQMARPYDFSSVANAAFLVLVALYVITSFMGYWVFGSGVASPILCNLPRDVSTPLGLIATLTKLVIALHVITAVPLLLNPFALEVEHILRVEKQTVSHAFCRTLVRATLLGAALVVALYVPYFGDVMGFVGAACITMLVFVLPVILTWRLRPESLGLAERLWGALIMLVGLSAGALGTVNATTSILQKLREA